VSLIASIAVFEVLLLTLLAVILYGPYVLLSGFQNRPRMTGAVFAFCVVFIVAAGVEYDRTYHPCGMSVGWISLGCWGSR
jgi:hypothetical protein